MNEETETVTIYRDCKTCGGKGSYCDYMCYWNDKKMCDHKTKTWCNCNSGQVDVEIEMPKSVVEQYYND